jgi:phosphate-selective porin OprO/OprP
MPGNRPTICTADDQNCIAITSRVHFDIGGYDYHPNTAATVPQRLDDGANVRRGRIGVIGKFFSDWEYALIYDFGGSSDGFGGTASAGGVPVGFLPGGATSGIENAYLSYTGLKPFGGRMAIEGGVMDLAYTLDEATSSNDIAFMERASSSVVAMNIAAGDFRSAVGGRWYNDRFWAGAYVTGPTTGAIHSASSVNPPGTTEQYGAVARVAGQIVSGKDYSLHIGGDAQWLIQPPHNLIANTQTLTLSDRPELRIDPTTILTTGAIAGVSGAQVYSIEAAATYGPLWLQGEYYWFNVDRNAFAPTPSLKFEGGYAQAAFVLTGETRPYKPASASYGGITPAHPFSLSGGGWGAWEIAARYSTIDLNDRIAFANGIAGGRQTVYTLALNWYVNGNVRFMLDYLHGNINKQVSPTNFTDAGAKFDAVAMRTQVAF